MCSVPSRVVELIETFARDIEAYHSQQYNETQLRREFIDPLFEELGWDVTNKAGYAQAYKDVIHEDAIKVGGATKAPDYCFRIGGVRKFFLEAKKPSVNIKGDPHPAYQLRRYAWSAKLPLSILTDFEEFAVYDCQTRPKQTDKADTARIMYFTYKQYPDKWAKIADVFSREAILKGSFDKFAVATKGKRGTTTVDVELLTEIEKWRDMLARIIALRNRALSTHEINFAVQRTIDRTLFLRMCEDRGIEDYGQLLKISTGDRTYPRLSEIFEKADQKYNSGLFHFHDESDRPEAPDKLTPNLVIDDGKLKWILHSLYYPQCPYEFSVLPPEILGNVYEQFLGSVIQVSPGRRVKVVPKPEVKKAGGVYYTPSYIVDYIVKNTVGRLLNDHSVISESVPAVIPSAAEESIKNSHCESAKGGRGNLKPLTPRQIQNLKILDPACGSGSFLLGAYTYLLNYHRDWYVDNDPQKYTKKIYQGKGGQWYLTNAEKKRILLNNIFGVDIDSQAVEVTKLSLLLKVLEGEDAQTLENQYRFFHERALPDLATNIKCGNSLIGPDFFDTIVIPSAAEESVRNSHSRETCPERRKPLALSEAEGEESKKYLAPSFTGGSLNDLYQKINPFDWHAEFPQIFNRKNPGFDAVIGNPPYRRELDYKHLMDEIASTPFGQKYRSPRMDLWYYFVHRSLELLRSGRHLSFIVNAYWVNSTGSKKLINVLRDNNYIDEIFFFRKMKVFSKVSGQHMIIRITSERKQKPTLIKLVEPTSETSAEQFVVGKSPIKIFEKSHDQLFTQNKLDIEPPADELLSKITKWPSLTTLGKVRQGIAENPSVISRKTNEKYGNIWEVGEGVFTLRPEEVEKLKLSIEEKKLLRPYHHLCDLGRYQIASKPSLVLIYSTKQTCPDINRYPKMCRHLKRFKVIMKARRETKKGSNQWWHLHWPRDEQIWQSAKIVSLQMGKKPSFVPSIHPVYVPFSANVFVPHTETKEHLYYISGLLNSKVMVKWYQHYAKRRGAGLEINGNVLSKSPIRPIDFSVLSEKAKHDKMVKHVERMLDLHKKLAAAKIPDDKTRIQRQIANTDKQIDNLVYQLYGLTKEEIEIVEENQ